MTENIICFVHRYTLEDANLIIVLLILIVIALIVIGCYNIHHNRIISQRNEQLQRILTALDDYRAIVGNGVLSLDEQEAILNYKMTKTKEVQAVQKDGEQNFLTFCNLVPRYKDPDRTLDYINSLRAEYGARLIIEHPHEEIAPLAKECGFIGADAFISAFKFALGVTPSEYRNSMLKLFKNEK